MRSALLFLLLLSPLTHAWAATFSKTPIATGKGDLITIDGRFEFGDEKRFIELALSSTDAIVAFNSPGGNLNAGIEMGKAIHLKGFATMVSDGANCASACALAWLGGRERLMGPQGRVGFHAAYMDNGGQPEVSSAANALVGAYVNSLGLPTSAVIFVASAPPDKISWLSFADARQQGIDVKEFALPQPAQTQPALTQPTLPRIPYRPAELQPVAPSASPPNAFAAIETTFFRAAGGDKQTVRAYVGTLYEPVIVFYGKQLSRLSVLKEKLDYVDRWPVRQYQLDLSSLSAACLGNECKVSGTVSWNMNSFERHVNSTGAAAFEHVWRLTDQVWKLASENGKVIDRSARTMANNDIKPPAQWVAVTKPMLACGAAMDTGELRTRLQAALPVWIRSNFLTNGCELLQLGEHLMLDDVQTEQETHVFVKLWRRNCTHSCTPAFSPFYAPPRQVVGAYLQPVGGPGE